MGKVWWAVSLVALGSAAFAGPITYTYNYTGNTGYCVYGTCPANFASDYATASVTLNTPALPRVRTNWLTTANLVSWTFGDALGNITPIASTDQNAASEVTFLAFNGSGTAYGIATASSTFDLFGPAIFSQSVGGGTFPIADHLAAPGGIWQVDSQIPGQWSVAINGEQGGTPSAPVFLTTGLPISGVSGTTSGAGSTDYYSFYWVGGAFSANTAISNILSSGDSFQFSLGNVGSCNTLASTTLDSTDSYTGSISLGNLSAGDYCIGIGQTAGSDPDFALTFTTPLSAAPEPAAFVLVGGGLAMLCAFRRRKRRTAQRSSIWEPRA